MSKPLTDKDRQAINQHLRNLEELHEDTQRAIRANIPGADEVAKRIAYTRDNFVKMKAEYFKGKA